MIINAMPREFTQVLYAVPAIPAQAESLTASGSAQSPTWSNFSAEWFTVSGTTSATSAGTYTVMFTPTNGYCWPDGTTETRSADWSIT